MLESLYNGHRVAKSETKKIGRLEALDYLRGFFILVIIIDHLWRWPNIFQAISGRGELWVSAAEGFVAISGLLVGYIRGRKAQGQPMLPIAKKLISRGIVLYIWMIITSLALVAASWLFVFKGDIAYIPYPTGDWAAVMSGILRLDYVHTLTHFLYLYAIFLVISPLAILALRKGAWWLVGVASAIVWGAGVHLQIEWMQWQILFFIPTIIGYYLESIVLFFREAPRKVRLAICIPIVATTLITMLIAALTILPNSPGIYVEQVFTKDPTVSIWRVLLSFIWITGLYMIFSSFLPFLKKWFGWLLQTLGERSLTAYIVHIIPLTICQLLFAETDNFLFNSLLAAVCVMATWGILRIPYINKIIPR